MRQPAGTPCGWRKLTRRPLGGPTRLAAARRKLSRPAISTSAAMPMSAGPGTSAATFGGPGPPECARGGLLGPPPTPRQDMAPAPGHPLWPIVARQLSQAAAPCGRHKKARTAGAHYTSTGHSLRREHALARWGRPARSPEPPLTATPGTGSRQGTHAAGSRRRGARPKTALSLARRRLYGWPRSRPMASQPGRQAPGPPASC